MISRTTPGRESLEITREAGLAVEVGGEGTGEGTGEPEVGGGVAGEVEEEVLMGEEEEVGVLVWEFLLR